MTIVATKLSLEEINAVFLRLQRQMKNEQAALETKVTQIVDNSKTIHLTTENDFDDSYIRNELQSLGNLIIALQDKDIIQDNDISNLEALLSNINVVYDTETNTLNYTDSNGEEHSYILKGTTYTFEQDGNDLIITNDLDPLDTFTYNPTNTEYLFSYSDGVITIHNQESGVDTVIDLTTDFYDKDDIQALILDLIPAQASSSNQLADKAFVNSSIETATATFRGTYTTLADLEQAVGDKNDYAFLKTLDATSGLYTYDKYTYVEGTGWTYAYSLNTSGFTAAQLAALNSGITDTLVSKITDVYNSTITVCQGSTCVGSFTLNQSGDATLNLTGGNLCRCCDTANHNVFLLGSDGCSNAIISQVNTNNNVYFNPSTGTLIACSYCTGNTIYGPTYTEMYSGSTPYLDFHFCNYCGDYSQRIISRCGRLDITVNNGYCNTASTQSATYCFDSNGYLCLPNVCASQSVRSALLCSTNTICGAGYFRQICVFKPEVCTTSAGWCQCHFYAFADVTTLFDGSNHGGECYTAGFVGNIFEHRDNGGHAENITQAIARIGYNCSQRVLCYFPTMGQDWVEPRVLYKCDECKYYLGLWFKAQRSSHGVVLEGVFQVGSCLNITPKWICSCTTDGCIACSCWAVCGSKASLSLNINSACNTCCYPLTVNCNNQLFSSNTAYISGGTVYATGFNGLFNRNIIDVTSQVTILGCNCDVVKCATYDQNFNMYHVWVCTKSNIGSGCLFANCIQFPRAIDKCYAALETLSCTCVNNRGFTTAIFDSCGNTCQLCFQARNTAGTFNANTFCLRIDIPAVCAATPITPTTCFVNTLWCFKDAKDITQTSSCCLFGVRLHASYPELGPINGLLRFSTSCNTNDIANMCFVLAGTKSKSLIFTSNASTDSNGCLYIQPYMALQNVNSSDYWFIFATCSACNGQILTAEYLEMNSGLGSTFNGINSFQAVDLANFDTCQWRTYYVDTTTDDGSVSISNLAVCHTQVSCMSTTSALKRKKNIKPFSGDALNILRSTDIVEYNYKNEKDTEQPHIGFIADWTDKTLSGSNQDQMRVNDSVGVLMQAVKELDYQLNNEKLINIIKRRIKKWFWKK